MQIIILSGGSGKRLWPLSDDINSKQFLKLLPSPNGTRESMIQRIVRQIKEVGLNAEITISTSSSQYDIIREQLGEDINIVCEPERRDTFPAIALASIFLKKTKGITDDEPIIVIPCDSYVDNSYFETIQEITNYVESDSVDIVLMGITPTEPSSKFGYIIPTPQNINLVKSFVEKPTKNDAENMIKENAMWNGGVFGFKLGYLFNIASQYCKFNSFEEAKALYSKFPKISFDYEVLESAESIGVIQYSGIWQDLGTWDSLSNMIQFDNTSGKVIHNNCHNSTVINESDIPIICNGIENLIIVVSPKGILISERSQNPDIKDLISSLTK